MNRPTMTAVCFGCYLAIGGCVSQQSLSGLGTEYEKANSAAAAAVATESGQAKRVRRLGAIIAYINNPSMPITENLSSTAIVGSFANFVCAGADDFEVTSAGLEFTAVYAKTIKAITTAPEDSINGYLEALSSLKGKDQALAMPMVQKNQFEACRRDVVSDVPPKGVTAVTARQESIAAAIAAVEAAQALIEALQKLAKTGLRMVTEAEQRAVLKSFIDANQPSYQRVLNEDLKSSELTKAFERRRHVAVAAPYYAFEAMMHLSPKEDRVEIMKRAASIDADLAEYDAIRTQRPPAAVVEHFARINRRLQDYADGKVSLADVVAFFSEIASELQTAKKNYDAVAKKVTGFASSVHPK